MRSALYWIYEFLITGEVTPGLIFALYIWAVFFIRMHFSMKHRDAGKVRSFNVSVILPVYNETSQIFRRCLSSLRNEFHGEIIVVGNGEWHEKDEVREICRQFRARWISLDQADKRVSIAAGVSFSSAEVVILADSDTIAAPNFVRNILLPFADAAVGGVTSRQRIFEPELSVLRRIADWLENLRYLVNQRAQSHFGSVGCLPGRMIAIRREIIVSNVDAFVRQEILGVRCISGDDRFLTSCCLRSGFKTQIRSNSLVFTEAPSTWTSFIRQQLRWARSSQRETLFSLHWLYRYPFTLFCFIVDIVTPIFFLAVVVLYVAKWRDFTGDLGLFLFMMLLFATLSLGARQVPHLWRNPRDLTLLPLFVVVAAFLVLVRVFGLLSCLDSNWLTRNRATADVTS